MIATLALVAFFPTAGHAAAWGVLISGVLQVLLVGGDCLARRRADRRCAGRNSMPTCGNSSARSGRRRSARWACSLRCSPTPSSRASCRPARCRRSITPTGSTSFRSASSASPPAPWYCRKCRAASPPATTAGAMHAQNRAIEFTLLLAIPCLAAFFVIPDLIMRALFVRGAFTAADAVAAGATLAAYAFGLLALRADPQRGRDLLRARRHRDAGEGGACSPPPSTSRSSSC